MKSQARTDASLIERLAGHWLKSDPGDRASRHLLRRQVMLIDRLARIALIVLGGIICSSACAAEPTPWPAQYLIDPWDHQAVTPADVVGPDGLVYPDFRRAGVEGGIPDTVERPTAPLDGHGEACILRGDETGGGGVYQWGGKEAYRMVAELRAPAAAKPPVWLRLERSGGVFRAYSSHAQERPADAEGWTLLDEFDFRRDIEGGYKVAGSIDEVMYFGMFVNADEHYINDGGEHPMATATFDQVTVTGNADE